MMLKTTAFCPLVGVGESAISALCRGDGGFKPAVPGRGRIWNALAVEAERYEESATAEVMG
jgi:hypothetical protein